MVRDSSSLERHPSTGIDVLVVGAGLGGLFAAIELYRQGHSPRLIEAKPDVEVMGDFVGIGPSATRQFLKWPGMSSAYSSIVYQPTMTMFKYDGEFIGGPFPLAEGLNYRPVPVSRPKLIRFLYDYAVKLGIPILFGKKVVRYEESTETKRAFAITDQNDRFEADLVVAADGIGSRSGQIMLGEEARAMSSGFSVYRVTYSTALVKSDPFLSQHYPVREGEPDSCQVFIAPKGQMIILVAPDITTWLLTHEDKGQAEETWSKQLSADDAIAVLEADPSLQWDDRVSAIIKRTPPGTVVDYKITFRDPNPTWTSPSGRVVRIGDSAHAFIPNSSNGATQAMEDGASLAVCLRLAGKSNVALATRMHTKLRFERVSCAQRAGFKNRDRWHTTDFEAAKRNPKAFATATGEWINGHDPEQYVLDNWEACLNSVVSGSEFTNSNTPPGYTYEPWTMADIMRPSEEGQLAADPGNWD